LVSASSDFYAANNVDFPLGVTVEPLPGWRGPIVTDALLRAIDLALDNQWDAAHHIVQKYDNDPTAAWIHAVLHKIEGDLDNSRYWYRRAGKSECVDREPIAELGSIKASIEG
jgi:hypothetical protein